MRRERRGPLRLDRRLVHVAGVVIANRALVRSRGRRAGRARVEHLARSLLRQVEEIRPSARAAAIGRDLGSLEPRAVGVLEEIVAGRDGRIHAGAVDVMRRRRRGRGGRGGRTGAGAWGGRRLRGASARRQRQRESNRNSRSQQACHDGPVCTRKAAGCARAHTQRPARPRPVQLKHAGAASIRAARITHASADLVSDPSSQPRTAQDSSADREYSLPGRTLAVIELSRATNLPPTVVRPSNFQVGHVQRSAVMNPVTSLITSARRVRNR